MQCPPRARYLKGAFLCINKESPVINFGFNFRSNFKWQSIRELVRKDDLMN